jgi:hypothetical protein
LGTMFLTSSSFSLLKMSAPEDHQVSHKCLPLCSTTSKRKDTSLLAFGTDSRAMLNSLLGCLQAKILMWGSLSCYCPPSIVFPSKPTTHIMNKCMLGCHVEKKQVTGFLLHYNQNLAVLLVIRPHMTGSLAASRKYRCIIEFSWDVDVQAWETLRSSLDKTVTVAAKFYRKKNRWHCQMGNSTTNQA